MNKAKLKLWLCLSVFGLVGVASLLLTDFAAIPNRESLPVDMSPTVVKLLLLINPSIMVIVSAFLGSLVYDKVGLRVPVFESVLKIKEKPSYSYKSIILWGIPGGIAAGILVVIINYLFTPALPFEYLEISDSFSLNIITRFLYGGVVEEIMMRFGLMTLLVWALYKIFRTSDKWIFVVANILAALLFAVGHLPVLLALVSTPNIWLYLYILLANGVGGIIFGFMYIKRGLECAMIAHLMTHVVMLILL